MEDCIFCKIGKGEVSVVKVYEDTDFVAFLDINPVTKGHTLLIPKSHYRWLQDVEDSLIEKTFVTAKNLMTKIKKNLACDYVQLAVMGEEVSHFHVHLIPAIFSEKTAEWKKVKYDSDQERSEYALKIKS